MSSFLRLAVFAGVIFVGFMLLYRPAELRHAAGRADLEEVFLETVEAGS